MSKELLMNSPTRRESCFVYKNKVFKLEGNKGCEHCYFFDGRYKCIDPPTAFDCGDLVIKNYGNFSLKLIE